MLMTLFFVAFQIVILSNLLDMRNRHDSMDGFDFNGATNTVNDVALCNQVY